MLNWNCLHLPRFSLAPPPSFWKIVLPEDVSTVAFRGHIHLYKLNFKRKYSTIFILNDLAVDRPPSLISPLFPVSHRTLENLQTRRRFTRVYGGKIIFVDMYVFCVNVQLFSLFYSSLQQITPIIHKPGKN